MPSSLHEVLIEMFRQRPVLAAELLAVGLDKPLPTFDRADLQAADATTLTPTEYRADAVVVLSEAGSPLLAVVVEVQLRRDPAKQWGWPVYLATLRARIRCPTVLLVLCVDTATANWCANPIDLGPGTTMAPTVLGPAQVPLITDNGDAERAPELSVLSAVAHGAGPNREKVLNALLSAMSTVQPDLADLYYDLVLAALPRAAQHYLEELMAAGTYEYQSDFARRYYNQGVQEGQAAGQATAVLAVLDSRGLDVPTETRTRITTCTDTEQLDTWIRRAVTATAVDELFAE